MASYYQHSVKNLHRKRQPEPPRTVAQEVHDWFVRHEWAIYLAAMAAIVLVSKVMEAVRHYGV